MSIPHVKSGDIINLHSLPEDVPSDKTFALTKTKQMEVIRMTLVKDKSIPEHHVSGEVSIFCLEGEVEFQIGDQKSIITPGDWFYMSGGEPHSLRALADSSLLATILL